MCMRGEKLLFTGTRAPMKGRSLYGLGIPTPKTFEKDTAEQNEPRSF